MTQHALEARLRPQPTEAMEGAAVTQHALEARLRPQPTEAMEGAVG